MLSAEGGIAVKMRNNQNQNQHISSGRTIQTRTYNACTYVAYEHMKKVRYDEIKSIKNGEIKILLKQGYIMAG